MKICILGTGALGCAFGGTLSKAGHEVWLLGRSPESTRILTENGLILKENGETTVIPVHATTDYIKPGIADLVIVLVKSYDTATAINAATSLLGPDTLLMSLQNGLGHETILANAVGHNRLLAGKTYVGGVIKQPGVVSAGIQGKKTIIGEPGGGNSERAQCIANLFCQAGLQTETSNNMPAVIWDKLLINVATGAITALTGMTYGQLYQNPALKQTALAAVNEAMQVAQALGVSLSIPDAEAVWFMAATGLADDFKTSMLQSLEKGMPTEIDFINGAVVKQGKKAGIDTPVNQTLVSLLGGLEQRLGHHNPQNKQTTNPVIDSHVQKEHQKTPSPPINSNQNPTTPAEKPLTQGNAYLEHTAIRVSDIHWHIRFFKQVLGLGEREIDGDPANPRQYWTIGGIQLISDPDFCAPPTNEKGWLAHLGIMVDDLDAVLERAKTWDVTPLPQGPNWLQLPDGLALEFIQAAPGAVAQVLAINPRT